MDIRGKRHLVYTTLVMLCGVVGAFLGLAAGIWSFVQVAAVIELTYRIGASAADFPARDC